MTIYLNHGICAQFSLPLLSDFLVDIEKAHGFGADFYMVTMNENKIPQVAAIRSGGINYIQQMVNKAHSLGMKIIIGLGPEYYTSKPILKNKFLIEPAARTAIISDLDWFLTQNIDGLMLHEPTPNGAVSNCTTWKTFLNAFFLECDQKVKAVLGTRYNNFAWCFVSGSNSYGSCGATSYDGLLGMGIDFNFLNANNIFNYHIISTPTNNPATGLIGLKDKWVGAIGWLPGRLYTLVLYVPIGGTNTNLNPYFIPQLTNAQTNGLSHAIFTNAYITNYHLETQVMTIWGTPPTKGYLDIISTPPGASILFGEGHYGTTPRSGAPGSTGSITIDPGTYTLVLSLTGYNDYMEDIIITSGNTEYRNIQLVPSGDCPIPICDFIMTTT